MDMGETGVIIAGGIVGIIIISVIAYFFARAMKGSLKLSLNQKMVRAGEKITGRLTVTLKKPILADRLYIGLIGEREARNHNHGNQRNSTRWVEFFRDEADILADQHLRAGFQETYEFELDTPSEAQVMNSADAMLKALDSMPDGAAKSLITGIGSIAASAGNVLQGRKRWKVISRLETTGVDLAASERIHVSLKSAV